MAQQPDEGLPPHALCGCINDGTGCSQKEELAALRRESVILRAKVETAASMVKYADPDLAEAMLRVADEPEVPSLAKEILGLESDLAHATAELDKTRAAIELTWRPEVAALRAKIARLENVIGVDGVLETKAENERLQQELDYEKRSVEMKQVSIDSLNEEVKRTLRKLDAVRDAVDSFDNRDVSCTPDQRDVVDAVRLALRRQTDGH